MPPLSKNLIFWHTVRTLIFGKLCHSVRAVLVKSMLKGNIKMTKVITLLALLIGTIVYRFLSKIFDMLLCFLKPSLSRLVPFDEVLAMDNEEGTANISAILRFEKAPFDEAKKYWRDKFFGCK